MLRIYYLRSKISNSMYCPVVKNLVSIKISEIESQHFEFRNRNAKGTNSGDKQKLCI